MECGGICCVCIWLGGLALSLTLWILGCNPDVPGGCLVSSVQTGTLIKIQIFDNQCCEENTGTGGMPLTGWLQDSNSKSDDYSCKNNDFSCCYSDRTWNLTGINKECQDSSSLHHNCSMSLGTTRKFTYNPRSESCIDADAANVMWWIGVVLLFCYFMCLICCIYSFLQQRYIESWIPLSKENWEQGVEEQLLLQVR
jgi:hypothetical protein